MLHTLRHAPAVVFVHETSAAALKKVPRLLPLPVRTVAQPASARSLPLLHFYSQVKLQMLLWMWKRGTFPAEFEAGFWYLKLLLEMDCFKHVFDKMMNLHLMNLMNADRIQCWQTQTRYLNYRRTDSRAGRGAGSPRKEPCPACLARCATRLLDEGRTSNIW